MISVIKYLSTHFGALNAAKRQQGATLIEYALIAALIAVAAVAIMGTVGENITSVFTSASSELSGAASGGGEGGGGEQGG